MSLFKIIGVAIRHSRGSEEFCFMSKPWRHHDVIRNMAESGFPTPVSGEQGFILNNGEFINRKDALELALTNGQVKDVTEIRKPNLYSEDLW